MRRRAISLCLHFCLAAMTANVACDGGAVPSGPPPSFAADPSQTLTSDSGALRVAVRFAPDPPAVGSNAVELTFTDANGAGRSGLGLSVVPWMPAHGHGTSVDPMVTETTPGTFVAAPVYLFMPGSWELRITTSGTVDDTAKAAFEIP